MSLLNSPLHQRHLALGAKMADFGGWDMPIEYPTSGGGVVQEHLAVRRKVGFFDVSHLGKVVLHGPGVTEFLNSVLTNDLQRIGVGQAQYTFCCDPNTGGVIDDLIAYRLADDEILLVPNAANAKEIVQRITAHAPVDITIVNYHEQYGIIAVQGPRSADVLQQLGLPAQMPYLSFVQQRQSTMDDIGLVICRTGYTGEHGYELIVSADSIGELWDDIAKSAAEIGGMSCGLGARDTLRTEMGYLLHGQDVTPDISPIQASASWAVGWKKPEFWGRSSLMVERESSPQRLLWGVELLDRGIPRPQMTVVASGAPIGRITSGTFSPTRQQGIGLALISNSTGIGEGTEVQVDIRGRFCRGRLVRPPFVPSHVRD